MKFESYAKIKKKSSHPSITIRLKHSSLQSITDQQKRVPFETPFFILFAVSFRI